MLTSVDGLPLHPLVVHAVVVLLPLATLGALAVAARPRWARTYGPLVAATAVVAAVASVVAVEAGQALEAVLLDQGTQLDVQQHAAWGGTVRTVGLAFAVVVVASTVLAFRAGPGTRPHLVTAWLAVALGLVATVHVYLAGQSGAESVWGYVLAQVA